MDNFNFDKCVSYQYEAKEEFLKRGRRQLRRVARAMGLVTGQYEVRVNRGGNAVSGEVTLHSDHVYCQLYQPCTRPGASLLYRTCEGSKDYCGGHNNFLPGNMLNDADKIVGILVSLQHTVARAKEIEDFERWQVSEPHAAREVQYLEECAKARQNNRN